MEIIKTNSLTKRFGTTLATDRISIRVIEGGNSGFLGINGAGEISLIRMLRGMTK